MLCAIEDYNGTFEVKCALMLMNQTLRRLGITSDTHAIHGFRASARTMIAEKLKVDERYIEMQLGHRVPDMHRRAYNRKQFIDECKEMLQKWTDYLDELKS